MGAPVVHFEIECQNHRSTVAFYRDLFGWGMAGHRPTMSMANTGSTVGIQGHLSSLRHPPHQYVTVYVQVDDLEASLAKASKLGGKAIVPPQEVPGMGHFAWFQDPAGNRIGLWKPMGAC